MKSNVLNSLIWKFMERIGMQLVNFIVTLILARILGPNDYGTVALLSIFVTFATVIVQDGFNVALIRKKDANENDFTSAFVFSIFLSIILYVILFFASHLIANFYQMDVLVNMLRVLSLVLFPAALNSIQVAYFTKKFDFKKMFICNFFAMIISGVISISSAFIGFGAWAIILNQLIYQVLSCIFMWFYGKWRPRGKFSFESLRKMIGFGSKMLFTSLLVNLFLNIRSLLIGKYYDSTQLGYFTRGKSFSSTLMEGVNGSIQTVLLPTYAKVQESLENVKKLVRKSVSLSCYVIFPMLIGLACVAEPLVLFLLDEKWLEAVPFIQIFALTYMFQPPQIATAQALKALEHGNTILKIEIIRKTVEIVLLIAMLLKGPLYIALSALLAGFISLLITVHPNKKLLNYSYLEQIKDFSQPLCFSLIMGVVIILFNHYILMHEVIVLIIDVIFGVIIYIGLSILFKNENFVFLKEKLFEIINKLKGKRHEKN